MMWTTFALSGNPTTDFWINIMLICAVLNAVRMFLTFVARRRNQIHRRPDDLF